MYQFVLIKTVEKWLRRFYRFGEKWIFNVFNLFKPHANSTSKCNRTFYCMKSSSSSKISLWRWSSNMCRHSNHFYLIYPCHHPHHAITIELIMSIIWFFIFLKLSGREFLGMDFSTWSMYSILFLFSALGHPLLIGCYFRQPGTTSLHSSDCSSSMPR